VSAYIHKEKELQRCTLNIYYEITKKFKSHSNHKEINEIYHILHLRSFTRQLDIPIIQIIKKSFSTLTAGERLTQAIPGIWNTSTAPLPGIWILKAGKQQGNGAQHGRAQSSAAEEGAQQQGWAAGVARPAGAEAGGTGAAFSSLPPRA
jgi:hypothetical protein